MPWRFAPGAAKLPDVDDIDRFRDALIAWAAAGPDAPAAAVTVRDLAVRVRSVVLVEGGSDRSAVETLAIRRGRDLGADGVCVVPMGGAMSIGRFLALVGPQGLDLHVAGLCDAAEEDHIRRGLERTGFGADLTSLEVEALGFYVCVADLEDEMIRSLGVAGVEAVAAELGDLRRFRMFQDQPAQRGRAVERQLRRFMGTTSGRKARYAAALAAALDRSRVPEPLEHLLGRV
jgi:hypothetical protein